MTDAYFWSITSAIELSFGAFSPRHLSCTWAAVVAAFGRGRRGRRGRWRIAREKCKSLCSAEVMLPFTAAESLPP